MGQRKRTDRLRWGGRAALAVCTGLLSTIASVWAPPASSALSAPPAVDQGGVCLASTGAAQLNHLFDSEPGGIIGADYQRAHPLPDGRVLWLFQDGAVRNGGDGHEDDDDDDVGGDDDEFTILHNFAMLQDGNCFDVLYNGTLGAPVSFLFGNDTAQYFRWFWPLGSTMGDDGLLYIFAAEMTEQGDGYLTHTVPNATYVAAFDPMTSQIVYEGQPSNKSADLYGWSVTSDDQWTYLYAQCYRQFGFDLYRFAPAFDRSCASRLTVGRLPRGQPFATPTYWDGNTWQSDPQRAAAISDGNGTRLTMANQVRFTGTSFYSINYAGDWWGDTIHLTRSQHPAGPFEPVATLVAPLRCATDCNSFFASWIPRESADRPAQTLVFGVAHNRWDGEVSTVYRPSFHEVEAPVFMPQRSMIDVSTRVGDQPSAIAVALNVTATQPGGPGYVTTYPCDGERPTASNLNYAIGHTVANMVIARPDDEGKICMYTLASTELVVDLLGTFDPIDPADQPDDQPGESYVPADVPIRLIDTRVGLGAQAHPVDGGSHIVLSTGQDPAPAAIALNVTATNTQGPGYITAYPCDQERPTASNLNYISGQTVANMVFARPDSDGLVCLFAKATTDLVVDLAGSFTESAEPSVYVPLTAPQRVLDTRAPSQVPQVAAGEVTRVRVEGAAVALNVTAANTQGPGYITAYPCDRERPTASNVNYAAGQTVANLVLARPDVDGDVCLFSLAAADLVVDIAGTFSPSDGSIQSSFTPVDTPRRLLDTRIEFGTVSPG